ncbi:MAG: phosphoribosylaminoimidazolesuccinocarboxamide synthase [Gemmatimonadota bacterium]|nr:MAG: phosphoribosylaminoimidazolesuccinocarboxamide synthase [Gemmatimonadota bacterium]
MDKKELICEGQSKKVYATSDPSMCILEFLDKIPAGKKKKTVKKRATSSTQISARLFLYLKSFRVLNHFFKTLNDKEMLVKKLDMFPFRVVVRNIATPDFAKRYGFEKNSPLTPPIFEFYPKASDLKEVAMNDSHVSAHGLATQEELRRIKAISTRINAVLVPFFLRRKLRLIEYYLEFGKAEDKIVLGDEISPDTIVLWDITDDPEAKKDIFSIFSKTPEKGYTEILKRVTQ